jgi:hypothetical protein
MAVYVIQQPIWDDHSEKIRNEEPKSWGIFGGSSHLYHLVVTGTMEFPMTFPENIGNIGNGKSSQLTNSVHHFSEG